MPLDSMDQFLRSVTLLPERTEDAKRYPFDIPAVRSLEVLALNPRVTFFVGENGSGKSTLVEAIAVAAGFNPEGGSSNFKFATRASHSGLERCLRIARGVQRPRTGYFLRAESFYNVATEIERLGVGDAYGDRALHEQSHGEAFLSLVQNRFGPRGLYILDEPEAALSPQRQLALLKSIDRLARRQGSQLIIATHSPLLLAYPNATIYALGGSGIDTVTYEQTEHYALTRDFLVNHTRYVERLLADNG